MAKTVVESDLFNSHPFTSHLFAHLFCSLNETALNIQGEHR